MARSPVERRREETRDLASPAKEFAMSDVATILLHLDGSTRSVLRTRVARGLAEAFGAQVCAQYFVTPSLLRYPLAADAAGGAADVLALYDEECRERAQAAFEAERAGASWLTASRTRIDSLPAFASQALHHDLMVLGQRNAEDPAAAETPPDLVPWLLVETGRPALLLPWAPDVTSVGRRVLVAWKPTRESARALSAALPWMQRADRVQVVCANEERDAVLSFLGAHDVEAHVSAGVQDESKAGEWLLSRAADVDADLLVMGAYGHSRTREWVLGGATRTVLQSMTLPVLMTH
jgi:nucleotide-binding universal stress UspA family protein